MNSSNASVPDMLAHRYRVIQVLGEGGFGTTYLASDTQMPSQRQCVVKQLKPMEDSPELFTLVQERFQREAAILELLGDQCDQIPRLYAYFAEDQQFYLVEEWIQGDTLSQKVMREGALPDATVRQILLDVLPALDIMHRNQMVHRDIKPDNILIRSLDQRPILIDFGAVKETMRTVVQGQAQSAQSIVVGTPGFMPSEQLAGYPVFSSDLFALGMTAIYLLTGRMPSLMESDPQTGFLHWQVYAPQVDPNLRAVIDQSIQLHPKDRFQSATAMQQALLMSTPDSHPQPVPQTVPWVPPTAPQVAVSDGAVTTPQVLHSPPPKKRVSLGWVLGGVTGVAIAAGASLLFSNLDIQISSQSNKPNPEPDSSTSKVTIESQPTKSQSSQREISITTTTTPATPTPSPSVAPSPSPIPSPPSPSPIPPPSVNQWEYMGQASTGETVSVEVGSIQRIGTEIEFRYRIGQDLINATANCPSNSWYVGGLGWYNPQSEATQNMMNYVCSF